MVIYCDAADMASFERYAKDPRIAGFTSNPSLMRKAGVRDYKAFARDVLAIIGEKDVSFEVTADDWTEMERQAREIASWGQNVYVKIPVTNTKGESCEWLVRKVNDLKLNITAVMTQEQINRLSLLLSDDHILSVFMGRIQDTGRRTTIQRGRMDCRTLWASTRQVLDVYLAAEQGFDICTITPDLIAKLALKGKDLTQYSLETVQQFYNDGKEFSL